MTNQTKDKIVNFSSVQEGKNSKGDDRVTLYLSPEEARNVSALLLTKLEASEGLGVKLDVHISDKQTKDGSRSFRSAYGFVIPKQNRNNSYNGGANKGGGRVVAKNSDADIQAQIAKLQGQLGNN
jgi:hypothetical protein